MSITLDFMEIFNVIFQAFKLHFDTLQCERVLYTIYRAVPDVRTIFSICILYIPLVLYIHVIHYENPIPWTNGDE